MKRELLSYVTGDLLQLQSDGVYLTIQQITFTQSTTTLFIHVLGNEHRCLFLNNPLIKSAWFKLHDGQTYDPRWVYRAETY